MGIGTGIRRLRRRERGVVGMAEVVGVEVEVQEEAGILMRGYMWIIMLERLGVWCFWDGKCRKEGERCRLCRGIVFILSFGVRPCGHCCNMQRVMYNMGLVY